METHGVRPGCAAIFQGFVAALGNRIAQILHLSRADAPVNGAPQLNTPKRSLFWKQGKSARAESPAKTASDNNVSGAGPATGSLVPEIRYLCVSKAAADTAEILDHLAVLSRPHIDGQTVLQKLTALAESRENYIEFKELALAEYPDDKGDLFEQEVEIKRGKGYLTELVQGLRELSDHPPTDWKGVQLAEAHSYSKLAKTLLDRDLGSPTLDVFGEAPPLCTLRALGSHVIYETARFDGGFCNRGGITPGPFIKVLKDANNLYKELDALWTKAAGKKSISITRDFGLDVNSAVNIPVSTSTDWQSILIWQNSPRNDGRISVASTETKIEQAAPALVAHAYQFANLGVFQNFSEWTTIPEQTDDEEENWTFQDGFYPPTSVNSTDKIKSEDESSHSPLPSHKQE